MDFEGKLKSSLVSVHEMHNSTSWGQSGAGLGDMTATEGPKPLVHFPG